MVCNSDRRGVGGCNGRRSLGLQMNEYPIQDTITIECRTCQADVDVKLDSHAPASRCTCGEIVTATSQTAIIDPIEVLRAFGIEVTQDFDGQLILRTEDELSEKVGRFVYRNQYAFKQRLANIRAAAQQIYIGGSLAGRSHAYWRNAGLIIEKIGKGHWEAYESRDFEDMRLYYVGRATSQQKAKRRQWVQHDD